MLKELKKQVQKFKKAICEQNEKKINKEIKRNQKEILKLTSTISEMENSLEGFKGRSEQAEESVNLKTGQWKLSKLMNIKKKD